VTRDAAAAELARLAAGVRETDEDAAASRLLEKVASAADPELLRGALLEAGARAVLREAAPERWALRESRSWPSV
jgi:hypothetical protein